MVVKQRRKYSTWKGFSHGEEAVAILLESWEGTLDSE